MENKNIKRTPKLAGTTFDSYGKMLPGLPSMKYSVEFVDAEPNRRPVMRTAWATGQDTMTALVGRLAGSVVGQLETVWMHGLKAKMEGRA